MSGSSVASTSATDGAHPQPSSAPAAASVKPQSSDHDGGDLQACVAELCKANISDIGVTPVQDVLAALQSQRSDVMKTFDAFMAAAKTASALSDEVAEQWKAKGNEDFAKGDGDVAIIHYTKAMTVALSDALVATLLNNRATVLLSQKRVRDALMDSHYALRLKPDYWKSLQRRGTCLTLLGFPSLGERDIQAAEACNVELANSEDALSDALRRPIAGPFAPPPSHCIVTPSIVVDRDAKGRFVVATKRIEPGTVLLESPYSAAPRGEGLFTACCHCMHRTPVLYASPRYRAAGVKARGLFCSWECAEAQWALYGHREHASPFYLLCSVDALLALRTVQTTFDCSVPESADQEDNHGDVPGAAGGDCEDVVKQRKSRKEAFPLDPLSNNQFGADFVNLLVGFSRELVPSAEVGGKESVIAALALHANVVESAQQAEKMRKAMRQINANAFHIGCSDRILSSTNSVAHTFVSVTVGKGVYPVASLFNHSCDPNCFVSFRGNPHGCSAQLCIRATRPIMEGEELTIAYAGIDKTKIHSTRARIRALRTAYGFACTCNVCRNVVDEVVKKDDEEYYVKAADYYQKGRRLIREGNYRDAITVLFQSYEIVMRYICPPPRPPQMMLPKTHDALAQAYLLNGERDKCVEHLRASLSLNVELHGGEYVDLVREYTRLAMLSGDAACRDKAIELLTRYYCPSEFLEAERAYINSATNTTTTTAPSGQASSS